MNIRDECREHKNKYFIFSNFHLQWILKNLLQVDS